MPSWFNLLVIALIASAGIVWWNNSRVRELAITFARRACDREGLQLLDQTVELVKVRMIRNATGHRELQRLYRFEFTGDAEHRDPGSLTMNGEKLKAIVLPFKRDEFGNRVFEQPQEH